MRRLLVGGLVVAALVAAAIWWWRRSATPAPRAGEEARARPSAVVSRLGGAPDGPAVPAWLGQPGRGAMRVAGRVLADGAPAVAAVVRLSTELERAEWPLLDVRVDDQGRFDLGALPAASYTVSAHAAGRAAQQLFVDLRVSAPTPPPDALELHLPPCTTRVAGTIRDASGGVVVGARVRSIERGIAETRSDDRGGYELCVPAQHGLIQVAADGYGGRSEHVSAVNRTRLDFTLTPEVVIGGRVVAGPDAQGVAGAVVSVSSTGFAHGRAPAKLVIADADGRFRVDGLGAGSFLVLARLEARVATTEVRAVRGGMVVDDLVLELDGQPVRLAGRVLADGAPVADAVVRASSTAQSWSASTDREGKFELLHTARAPLELSVQDHELVRPGAVAVTPRDDLVLEVRRLGAVSGVVHRAGKPVPGVLVMVAEQRRGLRRTVFAAADGRFEMKGLPAGTFRLTADDAELGAMSTGVEVTLAAAQRLAGVVVTMDLEASIAGVVVDASGAPVAEAAVSFRCERPDFGFAISGPDGRFRAGAMSGGCSYVPSVRRAQTAGLPLAPAPGTSFEPIAVADGDTHVEGVRLAVTLHTLSISGKVLRGGAPVPDVSIRAAPRKERSNLPAALAVSEVDGRFTLAGLPAGDYQLQVASGDGAFVTTTAAAGASDVVVELPGLGSIVGETIGFPRLERVSAQGRGVRAGARRDGPRFTIADLPAGTYHVEARGGDAEADAQVEVTAGAAARVTLRAAGVATLTGTYRALRGGAILDGMLCHAGAATAVTDAAGRFELRVRADSDIVVGCEGARGTIGGSRSVRSPAAGETRDVDLYTSGVSDMKGTGAPPLVLGAQLEVTGASQEATASGIAVGDRLVSVDDLPIPPDQLDLAMQLLGHHQPGQPYPVVVSRGGELVKLQLTNDEPKYRRGPAN